MVLINHCVRGASCVIAGSNNRAPQKPMRFLGFLHAKTHYYVNTTMNTSNASYNLCSSLILSEYENMLAYMYGRAGGAPISK